MSFINEWNLVEDGVYRNAKVKGFWEGDRNVGESIALMHSELSEALEAARHDNPPSEKIPDFSSLEEELADTVIRIMDFGGGFKLDVAGAIEAKIIYNSGRPYKHGKAF